MNIDLKEIFFKISASGDDIIPRIVRGNSILFRSPKHFGSELLYNFLISSDLLAETFHIVVLKFEKCFTENIEYQHIANTIIGQLNLPSQDVRNKSDFWNFFKILLRSKRIMIILKCRESNLPTSVLVINIFQELERHDPVMFYRNIVLFIFDDLSLYFYELSIKSFASPWDIFEEKKMYDVVTSQKIIKFFKEKNLFDENVEHIGRVIFDTCGGHQGLIHYAINYACTRHDKIDAQDWMQECNQILRRTEIMESITKRMSNLPVEVLEMALSFQNRKISDFEKNEALKFLHIYGIILKTDSIFSQLCQGVIADVVQEIYVSKSRTQVQVVPDLNKLINETSKVGYKKINIFLSYAHIDNDIKNLFQHPYLKAIQNHYREQIYVWSDDDIEAATDWDFAITSAITNADIFIPFITNGYMASEYIKSKELPVAIKRQEIGKLIIVPIYIEPIPAKLLIFQEKQYLPSMKPVKKWRPQSDAWVIIQNGIIEIIDDISSRSIEKYVLKDQ